MSTNDTEWLTTAGIDPKKTEVPEWLTEKIDDPPGSPTTIPSTDEGRPEWLRLELPETASIPPADFDTMPDWLKEPIPAPNPTAELKNIATRPTKKRIEKTHDEQYKMLMDKIYTKGNKQPGNPALPSHPDILHVFDYLPNEDKVAQTLRTQIEQIYSIPAQDRNIIDYRATQLAILMHHASIQPGDVQMDTFLERFLPDTTEFTLEDSQLWKQTLRIYKGAFDSTHDDRYIKVGANKRNMIFNQISQINPSVLVS